MNRIYLESIQKVNQIDSSFLQNLVWLIYCSPITSIKGLSYSFPRSGEMKALMDWISSSKIKSPDELKKHIPLGKYAEKLVEYYLLNSGLSELLAANLQLIENQKITIGELDFLFKDKLLNEFIHLEFSIKYYLKTTRNDKTIFLGPSTKDYMGRKIKKLLDHQTKLSQTHNHLLPINLQHFNYKSKAIVKGCLFFPWKEWRTMSHRNETTEGWWMSIDNIAWLSSHGSQFSLITKKINWIFPYGQYNELISFERLKEFAENHLNESNEVMVVSYDKKANPIDRGFIMKKNWPN